MVSSSLGKNRCHIKCGLLFIVCSVFYWLAFSHDETEKDIKNSRNLPDFLTRNTASHSDKAVTRCSGSQRAAFLETQCRRFLGGTHYDELLSSNFSSSAGRDVLNRMQDSLRIDDNHNLILCLPSKTGTTTFKSLLIKYSDKYINDTKTRSRGIKAHSITHLPEHAIKLFRFISQDEARRKLATHTKILVVRHPLVRLFSGYRQKVSGNSSQLCGAYQNKLAQLVLRDERRSTGTDDDETSTCDVTFPQFVHYFVRNLNTSFARNRHWDLYENVCHTCHIKYDHVIKLETGHSDELMLIDKFLNADHRVPTDLIIRNNESVLNEAALAANNYRQVLPEFHGVTKQDFDILLHHYHDEMLRYGYHARLTEKGLETACRLSTEAGDTCC